MQDSTEDSRQKKTKCIDSQEKMVAQLFNAIIDTKLLNQKITELYTRVDSNDKKHTEAINELRNLFTTQNTSVLESIALLKGSLDAFSERVAPYVDKAEDAKSFIQKWSPYAVVILLAYLAFGEKAELVAKFLIKVTS